MIQALALSKRYRNGALALDALDIEVEAGQIFCLVGAHGAGKTTTLDLFLGFIRPTAGQARINGVDVVAEPLAARRHVAYLAEDVALYDNLTALQNLELFARLGGRRELTKKDLRMAMRQVDLPEKIFDRKVHTFSKGMRQKLGIAIASTKGAPAILLDEPMSGLDPQATAELTETLLGLRDRGRALLVATHDLFHARQLADQVAILREGRKVLTCTRDDLRYQGLEKIYLDYMRGDLIDPYSSRSSSDRPY